MVGILGCGTIANIITNFTAEEKLGVDLEFFMIGIWKEQKTWHPK